MSNCTTHHHPCECREALHPKQVQDLEDRIDALEKELAPLEGRSVLDTVKYVSRLESRVVELHKRIGELEKERFMLEDYCEKLRYQTTNQDVVIANQQARIEELEAEN